MSPSAVLFLTLFLTRLPTPFHRVAPWACGGPETEHAMRGFFEVFYTVLVFSDVLIVLISLRYSSDYRIVFRNSGSAAATILIRLALTAPPYVELLLGLGAAGFALALSVAYNACDPASGAGILCTMPPVPPGGTP